MKTWRFILFLVGLSLACALLGNALGATYTAASVSRADVGAAVALADNGDIVEVPAGTAAWTTTLNITKAIHLKGAGKNLTIIEDSISSGGKIISFTTVAGYGSAMTGIRLRQGTRTIQQADGSLFLTGSSSDGSSVRIQGNAFERLRNFSIINNNTIGVIFDNDFVADSNYIFVYAYHNTFGGQLNGDGSWAAPADWSGTNNISVEGNRMFRSTQAYAGIDGYRGARIVFRFNECTNVNVEAHGTDSTDRYRGTRAVLVYGNTFHATNASTWPVNIRSGGLLVASNVVTGYQNNHIARLDAYRTFKDFTPWAVADGTSPWDKNDPAGAFYSGTSTGGGVLTITKSGAGWTTDQWVGYSARHVIPFTATSGGVRSVTVAGAGWANNQWAGYMFRSLADNSQLRIASNTPDTLTLHPNYPAINFATLGAFEIYRSSLIRLNTPDTLTLRSQGGYTSDFVFAAGMQFEIRKVLEALDQPGKGEGDLLTGTPPTPRDLNQVDDPVYEWENSVNGNNGTVSVASSFIRAGEHYFEDTPRPGWVPPAFPHPLVSGDPGGGEDPPPDPGPTPTGRLRNVRGTFKIR